MTKAAYHHGDLKNALIKAGAELLLEEGVGALSLRNVAARAGVSHSAPYAHFNDKRALIAAISIEGFEQLFQCLEAAANASLDDPRQMLVDVAYAYVMFAQQSPAYFKLMFSGVLENEPVVPDFVNVSRKNFQLLVSLVRRCQQAGVLPYAESEEILAVRLWSLVHGFTALLLEKQFSHTLLERYSLVNLLSRMLSPVTA